MADIKDPAETGNWKQILVDAAVAASGFAAASLTISYLLRASGLFG